MLLTGLSNNEWPDSTISYKLRVFENCATVLDVVFSNLERFAENELASTRTRFIIATSRVVHDVLLPRRIPGEGHHLRSRYYQSSILQSASSSVKGRDRSRRRCMPPVAVGRCLSHETNLYPLLTGQRCKIQEYLHQSPAWDYRRYLSSPRFWLKEPNGMQVCRGTRS